jgi:hypothetical protein
VSQDVGSLTTARGRATLKNPAEAGVCVSELLCVKSPLGVHALAAGGVRFCRCTTKVGTGAGRRRRRRCAQR